MSSLAVGVDALHLTDVVAIVDIRNHIIRYVIQKGDPFRSIPALLGIHSEFFQWRKDEEFWKALCNIRGWVEARWRPGSWHVAKFEDGCVAESERNSWKRWFQYSCRIMLTTTTIKAAVKHLVANPERHQWVHGVYGPIGDWNTSLVTSMKSLFCCARMLYIGKLDLGKWDTSSVTNMAAMFQGVDKFNPDICKWDTSSVTNMASMFAGASLFNRDIGGWDTSHVKDMSKMFKFAWSFNQDISGWDTSIVRSFSSMFLQARSFNQDIGGWDTSSAANMSYMFAGADSFNQDISGWDTYHVYMMDGMFKYAMAFNQDIGGWDTSNVKHMRNMFQCAGSFNMEYITEWDCSLF